MNKRTSHFLLILVLTLAVACCSHTPIRSADTKPSTYRYLTEIADQSRTSTSPVAATNILGNKNRDNLKLLVSFDTTKSPKEFEQAMRDTAFIYDNAVTALAFITTGDQQRAKQIIDAIIYAQNNDRFYKDGRIRNAYRGRNFVSSDGVVQLPGWFSTQENRWVEDEFQVSSHTGNVAWAMLALLGYYETYGGSSYLAATEKMGEWIEKNCRDFRGEGGYIGGFSGWEPHPNVLKYKATEHNLDLYTAFQRLYLITNKSLWQERANAAKKFVVSMWDEGEGKFWTGTKLDGVTVNKDNIPLDIQAWAILALRDEGKPYWKALSYAQQHHRVGDGFDFNQDRDRIWYEGTAQMAVAYQYTGEINQSKTLVSAILAAQDISGGIPAVNQDGMTTGFSLPNGKPWLYFNRLHVGATAWTVLAEKGVNPFWLGSQN